MEQKLVRLFLDVLNMSVTASYVIAAVLLLRLLLRRAPKVYSYALWSVVGFRLACPVSVSSALSLFNLRLGEGEGLRVDLSEVPGNVYSAIQPQAAVGLPEVNAVINAAILEELSEEMRDVPGYEENIHVLNSVLRRDSFFII